MNKFDYCVLRNQAIAIAIQLRINKIFSFNIAMMLLNYLYAYPSLIKEIVLV